MFNRPPKTLTDKRWSLCIVRDDELVYAMDGDNPITILGYVVNYFKNDAKPVDPWSLHLKFNATDESFQLKPSHFIDKENKTDPSRKLLSKIKSIDLNYKRAPNSDLIFTDIKNNKNLKVSDYEDIYNLSENDFKNKIRNRFAKKWGEIKEGNTKDTEKTFFDVMDNVFGK